MAEAVEQPELEEPVVAHPVDTTTRDAIRAKRKAAAVDTVKAQDKQAKTAKRKAQEAAKPDDGGLAKRAKQVQAQMDERRKAKLAEAESKAKK